MRLGGEVKLVPRARPLLHHQLFCFCRFADAASYMSQCADALEEAQEEIFITDWWYVFN